MVFPSLFSDIFKGYIVVRFEPYIVSKTMIVLSSLSSTTNSPHVVE
jgi:hypothetical protein